MTMHYFGGYDYKIQDDETKSRILAWFMNRLEPGDENHVIEIMYNTEDPNKYQITIFKRNREGKRYAENGDIARKTVVIETVVPFPASMP